MFADLLRIKKFREDAAFRAVKVAEARLAERLKAVRDAEEAFGAHHNFRVTEEVRLFQEIKGEPVHISDLDKMKQAVGLLRDDELRLKEKIEEEQRTVPPAQETLKGAKEDHSKAMTATEKFKQFVEMQQEIEKQQEAFREDAEAEEVVESILGARAATGARS